MIASVHVSPLVTLPVALLIVPVLVWYWMHLNRPAVPTSRRRRRRLTIVMLFAGLGLLIAGLSFIDPLVQQVAYITVWSLTLLLMLLIFVAACIDAVWTLRVDRFEMEIEQVVRRAREAAAGGDADGGSGGGEDQES